MHVEQNSRCQGTEKSEKNIKLRTFSESLFRPTECVTMDLGLY
jgi:hypothetical protein